MFRKPWLAIGVAILASHFAASGAAAEDNLLPDIQEIVDRGKLNIAVIDWNLPPMISVAEDGQIGGFDISFAKEIASALGVEPAFVAVSGSRGAVVDTVADGKADIGISNLTLNIFDGKRIYFTQPYLKQSTTLLVDRKWAAQARTSCPSRADFFDLVEAGKVAALRWDFYTVFGEREPDINPELFESLDGMLGALSANDIVASVQGEVTAKYFLAQNPSAALQFRLCDFPGRRDLMSIAVRPDAPDLLQWLNLYIEIRGVIVDADQVIYREDPVH